jgi:SAM-dependent methyltransferase
VSPTDPAPPGDPPPADPRPAADLFTGTAWWYSRYRPPLPPAFVERLAERCRLDGSGRLLDLGCGTGRLTLPLARHVAEAVGLDPEPEMLAEAARQAAAAGVGNVRWVLGGSADLPAAAPGPFRLVSIADAFHWMDRDAVLRAVAGMVADDGAVSIVGKAPEQPDPPWQAIADAAIRRHLGPVRRAGSGTWKPVTEPHQAALARSPFRRVERLTLAYQQSRTVRQVLGLLASTSYANPRVLGDRRSAFERELTEALLAAEPSGEFTEQLVAEALVGRLG